MRWDAGRYSSYTWNLSLGCSKPLGIDAVWRKQATETISQVPGFSSDKPWLIPGFQVPGHRRGCKAEASRTGLTAACMWAGVAGSRPALWVPGHLWLRVLQRRILVLSLILSPLFIPSVHSHIWKQPFLLCLDWGNIPKRRAHIRQTAVTEASKALGRV